MKKLNSVSETLNLLSFINELSSTGKIPIEISNEIEKLWNEYKLNKVSEECTVITADFGYLGSLVLRDIVELQENYSLKYLPGEYDYISVRCLTRRILWTDFEPIEPYNRQTGLYCDGASFKILGEPKVITDKYREYDTTSSHYSNISFAVWGYRYNEFYGSVRFGICIKTDLVDEFISKLKKIIGK